MAGAYVTSRGFLLPTDQREMSNASWFNMWARELWPCKELQPGDSLYWYESPTGRIGWATRVVGITQFAYATKSELIAKLKLDVQAAGQPYVTSGPAAGICLAYEVKALKKLSIPKPDGYRFPQQGWLRITSAAVAAWPGLAQCT